MCLPSGVPQLMFGPRTPMQILENPGQVTMLIEEFNNFRIVLLGAEHPADPDPTLMGDSVGHWEGDTLVVETTNLPQPENFFGSWKALKVTEWFTRVSPTRIKYRFQIEDPETWDQPWGGEYEFFPLNGMTYEYACHEGNYALPAILAGARREEQEATRTGKAKSGAD